MSELRPRPGCRQAIVNMGIVPYIDPASGKWDGKRCLHLDDGSIGHLSTGMRVEMKRMCQEGLFDYLDLPASTRIHASLA